MAACIQEHAMTQPCRLVAGIGNIFLGDDAFGVEVVRLLRERPLPAGVEVVDFGVRGFDLACALIAGYDGVVLVDAVCRGAAPGTLCVLEPEAGEANEASIEGHRLDPASAIRLALAMGSPLPRLRLVGC